jgi:hypothetical protein
VKVIPTVSSACHVKAKDRIVLAEFEKKTVGAVFEQTLLRHSVVAIEGVETRRAG